MKRSGEITVFLSMCLLCIWALLGVMLESARMAGSRYYFQVAAGSALDTLFSRYHRRLWEEYRIFALEYEEDEIVRELESHINEYLSVDNWYPAKLESVSVTQRIGIADGKGEHLAEEVLSFMKSGAAIRLFVEPDKGGQFLKDMAEAASVHALSGIYDHQEKETRKLERAVEKLTGNVQEQERISQEIEDALEEGDESGFFRAARDYRQVAGSYPRLMREYEKQAEILADEQRKTGAKLDEAEGDLQDGRELLLRQQWNPYETYLAQDGERRREFGRWENRVESNLELLDEAELLVQDDGNDEDEGANFETAAELWRHRYRETGMDGKTSSGDKEKRNFMDRVKEMAENGLLELVMPEGTIISGAVLATLDAPSKLMSAADGAKPGSGAGSSLPERVMINEYCGRYFTHALSPDKHPVQYEMEYLLQGSESDRRNLEQTVADLFAIREGMNLIHILSDSAKRREAEGLALAVAGAAGLTPLAKIAACVIMGAWAAGESIQDLRILMKGGKVPLWKHKDDWNTSLNDILDMGRGRMPDAKRTVGRSNVGGRGFAYEQYLQLLLLKENPQIKYLRMMDVMQMNIRREQPGFSMGNCACRIDIHAKAHGKHMFFSLPMVERFVESKEGYPLEATGEKAY